ncbi:MAG: adenylate/guanylate cyclase domain-containing protein [Candidatus Riflebacteria bacterium]|nr:adenylate/guanylate cyclase domain-containing protein [Candidatus Riflebacteria bacterium]
MKRRLELSFPVLLLLLLTALPLFFLHSIDERRRVFADDWRRMQWQQSASNRVERFRAEVSELGHSNRLALRLRRHLEDLYQRRAGGFPSFSAVPLISGVHRFFKAETEPTQAFAVSFDDKDCQTAISGPGLTPSKQKYMGEMLAGMVHFEEECRKARIIRSESIKNHASDMQLPLASGPAISGSVAAPQIPLTLQKAFATIFGIYCTMELVSGQRRGIFTPVMFEKKRHFLLWDAISRNGLYIGAYMLIFPQSTVSVARLIRNILTSFGEENRRRVDHTGNRSRADFFPLLVPISGLNLKLHAIVPPSMPSALRAPLRAILRNLPRDAARETYLPLGIVSESGGLRIMRDFLNPDSPYEIWMISSLPRSQNGTSTTVFLLSLIFATAGSGALIRLLMTGEPLPIGMAAWFSAIFALIGFLPLITLYYAGLYQIQASEARAEQDIMRESLRRLEDFDNGSDSVSNFAGEACRDLIRRPHWREELVSTDNKSVDRAVREGFTLFHKRGIRMQMCIVFFDPDKYLIFSDTGKTGDAEKSVAEFILSPLIRASLKRLEGEQTLLTEQKSSLSSMKGEALFSNSGQRDSALLEQQSSKDNNRVFRETRSQVALLDTGHTKSFQFNELVCGPNKTRRWIFWRMPMDLPYRDYLLDAGRRFRVFGGDLCIGRAAGGGQEPVLPESRDGYWFSLDGEKLKALMDASARSGARLIMRGQDRTMIAYSCRRAPGYILGTVVSFDEIRARHRDKRWDLAALTMFLFIPILLLGRRTASFLIEPLFRVETGLTHVTSGDLEMRVSLVRDDELGDLTRGFDEMIVGLAERRALGRFVSGSLNSSIEESASTEKTGVSGLSSKNSDDSQKDGPLFRVGVILVSDLRNFTTLSETYPVRDVVIMLNRHMEDMSRCIQARGGKIEAFIGDAIVAVFFESSIVQAAHIAVEAARDMFNTHRKLNVERFEAGLFPYRMGVGIDGGNLLTGTLHTSGRLDHVIQGEPRQRAEVLESISKKGKFTNIVVSSRIAALLPDMQFEPISGENALELAIGDFTGEDVV